MSEPTEREWLEGIGERFEREHEDGRPRSVFVERVDVDAAWEVYYQLADRRHQPGLTIEELRQVIDAALEGGREMTWCEVHEETQVVPRAPYCMHWLILDEEGIDQEDCRFVPILVLPLRVEALRDSVGVEVDQ